MLPDRVSNPGPLTYESGALPIALRGPASTIALPMLRSDELKRSSSSIYRIRIQMGKTLGSGPLQTSPRANSAHRQNCHCC